MKKLFAIFALSMLCAPAFAQWFGGCSFDLNYTNNGNTLEAKPTNEQYNVNLSPQFGRFFNDKFCAGARISFKMGKRYLNESFIDQATKAVATSTQTRTSIGWDVNPYVQYRIMQFGKNNRWGVWAEAGGYLGINYPTKGGTDEFKQQITYGIQALPFVSFNINEKTSILLHVAILSVGYAGTTTKYEGYDEYENTAVLFTGKIMGLFRTAFTGGMTGLRVGMCKRF